jgi:tetratricopeptide (TPR) repeat protein
MLNVRVAVALVICWCSSFAPLWAQNQNQADEAYSEGARYVNRREFDKARAPLETALQLAPDNKFRLKVFQALMPVYRTLPETDKMLEAAEYVIRYSDSLTDRSVAVNNLGSFLYQRGKVDEQVKRYREVVAAEADDYVAIAMLAELARPARLDRAVSHQYRERFEKAQRELAAKLAEQKEAVAEQDTMQKTWLWKEAAVLWSKSGDHAKAVAAATKAEQTGPETRGTLNHHWHANLGDVYLAAEKYAQAVEHFEKAIETTTIKGYQDSCKIKLNDAKEKLAGKNGT